jgi:RNA polymerase sigma-70 factor (ECF subfamily)
VTATADELRQFMTRLADGDRAAFPLLYPEIKPRVYALCRAMLQNDEDAQDALQHVMEKLFARASAYDRARPVLPWVLGIAAWQCRAYRQKRKRRLESALPQDDDTCFASDELNEELARAELQQLTRSALQTLSITDQEVLTATFWDEAVVSGAAGATVRKRRERALDRLRASFRRLYGFE